MTIVKPLMSNSKKRRILDADDLFVAVLTKSHKVKSFDKKQDKPPKGYYYVTYEEGAYWYVR